MESTDKIYKTPENIRNAIKKYTLKNSKALNEKNLEKYHKNMKDPEFVKRRRSYDRERKQRKALLKLQSIIIT